MRRNPECSKNIMLNYLIDFMVKVNFLFVSSGLSGAFSGVFLNIWSDDFWGLFFFKKIYEYLFKFTMVFLELLETQIKFPCRKISSAIIELRLLLLKKLALREIPLISGPVMDIFSSSHMTTALVRRVCLRIVSYI